MDQLKLSTRRKITNYFIVYLAILGVNPFFNNINNLFLFIVAVFCLIISFNRNIRILDSRILFILAIVYSLLIVQFILFKGFSTAMIYFPFVMFYFPYLLYKIFKKEFFVYFIDILYVICLVTTPLWFLQSVVPSFDSFLRNAIDYAYSFGTSSTPRSLIIYTAAWDDHLFNAKLGFYRNSGCFHEPGGYGIFLNLGIVINTFIRGKMFDRRNIVFIFCLLTTLSTAGFITLFIILTTYLWNQKISVFIKLVTISVFVITSYQVYEQEDFLKKKINTQYEDQLYAADKNLGRIEGQSGRFYAFFVSLDRIASNPFFGRGIIYATSEKALGETHKDSSYTYGIMGIMSTYGILFGIFFFRYFYQGFIVLGAVAKQRKNLIIMSFLAINMALSTQFFITTGIFVLIFYLGYYLKREPNLITNSNGKTS